MQRIGSSNNLNAKNVRCIESNNASALEISSYGNSKFQTRGGDSRDRAGAAKTYKPSNEEDLDLSNPYVFSSKFFSKKKRPQSTYESKNRFEIRNTASQFINRLNMKQEFMFKCLR